MKKSLLLGAACLAAGGWLVASVSGDVSARPEGASVARLSEMIRTAAEAPESAVIRLKIAQTLISLGRGQEALPWLEEARRLNPGLYDDLMNPPAPEVRGVSDCNPRTPGPDVIVGDMPSVSHYTTAGAVGGIRSYSVGTTSCNIGDANVLWDDEAPVSNLHPVIAQNMFRLKGGQFEQIGQSWLKHGFTALTGNLCCTCSGQGGSVLGVGCSDPYDAGLNGSYSWLGPKHEVNPSTASYPHPFGAFPNNSPIGKRLQVKDVDVDTLLNTGAQYVVEGHYIAPGEATFGAGMNDNNNASYRLCTVAASRNVSMSGSTQRTRPGIQAWKDLDAAVTIQNVDVSGDGRFIVAYKVTNPAANVWHYEFAIQNLNSDRAGQSFSVPVPAGVNVTNVGFHDVDWHSGAPYSNTDWTSQIAGGAVSWAGQTFAQNVNANALRWATLYNFRFDADQPPTAANATLTLFKTGSPASMSIAVMGPSAPAVPPCPADLDGDGMVGAPDLALLLGAWGGAGVGDLNEDGIVNALDSGLMLGSWGPCPS